MENNWSTGITEIKPNEVRVSGYDISELMGCCSFGEVVYLLLMGDLPSKEVGRLIEAIIVSSVDHGVTPPSTQSTRTVSSTGGSLSASVAAGILSINEHHGGAIENCSKQLKEIIEKAKEVGLKDAIQHKMGAWKKSGVRMSGFGHRVHTQDPRTRKIFDLADKAGISGKFIQTVMAVEKFFLDSGKKLPINVDGAIAAVLSDLKIPNYCLNGFFMIARTPGLIAHACEEKNRMKPMRKINPLLHIYDGPNRRKL